MTRLLMALLVTSMHAAAVHAQQPYPARPIRLVVPFAPGGIADVAARVVGRTLAASLAQPVVVDNRPSVHGAVAAQTVFSATPDGYTLLWASSSMVPLPLLHRSAGFDSLARFSPVSMAGQLAFGMFVYPGVQARTPDEFVRHARVSSGGVMYAAASLGEYLAAVQFMKASRTTMTRVPYKGGAQALPDLIAGRVQVFFTPAGIALPYAKDGRLRMLGVLLPERSPAAPDVPTMAEAGLPSVAIPSWHAIFGPPKTPAALVARVSQEVDRALQSAEVRQQLDKVLMHAQMSSPEQLAAVVARDMETWRIFIRENNIPVE